MIKVKNSQLNSDAIQALNNLIDLDINATAAFRLTRIIKEISSIIEDKSKMEKKILDKWTAKGEDGLPTRVMDDKGNHVEGSVNISNAESFNKEVNTLMNVENKISYEKLKFTELGLATAKIKDLLL